MYTKGSFEEEPINKANVKEIEVKEDVKVEVREEENVETTRSSVI